MYNEGILTFQAGEALVAHRRVKLEAGSTTTPPEIVYADAGEQHIGTTQRNAADGEMVAVKLRNFPGSEEVEAAGTFAYLATLYGADDGKIDDAASGSAIGVAKEAATAAGDVVEMLPFNVLSTTAATVSVADSGSIITGVTVEAALAEAFTHIQSAQKFIPVPLVTCLESDATNATALTGSTTPVLDMANGDTDSGLVLTWVASNSDAIIFQVPLPPDIDVASDVVVHFRAKSGGATDTPTIASDAYFNEGDTKVEDVSAALGAAYAEKTITIAAADVPAGAQTLTVELTPGAHTTDTIVLSAIWIEYTGTTLTS